MTSEPVVLADISVVYVESPNGLAGAAEAFDRLEARLATLRGRRFYGTFTPPDGPYRACVAIERGDDIAALGLPTWTIPGGKYRRGKLMNWADDMPGIGRTFRRLAEGATRDETRPSIEFYRSAKELQLFLPVT